jgi:hypothetical protein
VDPGASQAHESALVDAIHAAPTYADDALVLDSDVEATAVCAEDAGRLNPTIDVIRSDALGELLVYSTRPAGRTRVRSSLAPGIRDPLSHDVLATRGERT